ncbi:hypothetical protein DVS77_16960 [Mycolicibacterium moriokaense]|nr:hypothetical protein DVS77_16960 [Mycolicibacterium moriokaense]
MKQSVLVAVVGAAFVVAGVSGCSSDDKKPETPASSAGAGNDAATASAGAGGPQVTIDGQDQDVAGTVVCSAMGGNMNIAIGDAATGIGAVVSEGDSPEVTSVGLGNVNGVTLAYQSGAGQGDATATKDGDSYTISGTAVGVDMANPLQPVNKPFEINVTCP